MVGWCPFASIPNRPTDKPMSARFHRGARTAGQRIRVVHNESAGATKGFGAGKEGGDGWERVGADAFRWGCSRTRICIWWQGMGFGRGGCWPGEVEHVEKTCFTVLGWKLERAAIPRIYFVEAARSSNWASAIMLIDFGSTLAGRANSLHCRNVFVISRAVAFARSRIIDAAFATDLKSSGVKPSRLPARTICCVAVHAPAGLLACITSSTGESDHLPH